MEFVEIMREWWVDMLEEVMIEWWCDRDLGAIKCSGTKKSIQDDCEIGTWI